MTNKDLITYILFLGFFVSPLIMYFFSDNREMHIVLNRLSQICGLSMFIYYGLINKKVRFLINLKNLDSAFLVIILSILCGNAIHYIRYQEISWFVVYSIGGVGIAYYFIDKKPIKTVKVLTAVVIFIFIVLMVNGVSARYWGKGSENMASVLTITMFIYYYISDFLIHKQVKIYPVIILVMVNIYIGSRSGIAISLLCMLLILYLGNVITKRFIVSYFAILTVIVYREKFGEMLFDNYLYELLNRTISDDIRVMVAQSYLDSINLDTFLFGQPYFGDHIFYNLYGLSSHNSYLSLHSSLGIFSLVIILLLLFLIIKRSNGLSIYKVLLITVLSRAISDTVLFVSNGMNTALVFLLVLLIQQSIKVSENEFH